jgi:hypothetical protein
MQIRSPFLLACSCGVTVGKSVQNHETTKSDPPIVTRSSKGAITKSGIPSAFTSLERAWYPPYVPASAPMIPNTAPSTIPSRQAAATHAPHLRWLKVPSPLWWIGTMPAAVIFTLLALVELVTDKLPKTPSPGSHRYRGQRPQPRENPIKNANSRT